MTDANPEEQLVRVPLTRFVREIAREAAREVAKAVISEHEKNCVVGQLAENVAEIDGAVRKLQLRLVALVAFMLGSGALGGWIGAQIARSWWGA